MDITALRDQIDVIDDTLVQLFCKRMEIAEKIAEYKHENNLPIYVPDREREKLADVADMAGLKMADYAKALYTMLFELSRSYQNKCYVTPFSPHSQLVEAMKFTDVPIPQAPVVACPGSADNIQSACECFFPTPSIQYFTSPEEIFAAVETGQCQYCVLPIENSVTSSARSIYALIAQRNFFIVGSYRCAKNSCTDTRFICVTKKTEIFPEADKATVMMRLNHNSDALYRVLAKLYILNIQVAGMESFPIPDNACASQFCIDLQISPHSSTFVQLLCELNELCEEVKCLGSYVEVVS